MKPLNDDMQEALVELDITEDDRNILQNILYTERINKDKEWALDAKKYLKSLIDDAKVNDK